MREAPVTCSPPSGRRIVRDSRGWFSEGARLKLEARRAKRCVECHATLSSRRTPYCSRMCQWRFQGRYFWDAARIYVLRRDRYTCRHCQRRLRVRELEVDHILEVATGGPSLDYANLQTVCKPCHRAKTVAFARWRADARRAAPGDREAASQSADWLVDWYPA
ncbi:MAG: HNH endonuclease [Thermoplasmata archaeon]|nr:HNH endonuclease [Thermoplasmata archaeon]